MAAFFLSFSAHALDPGALEKLAFGDGDEKIEAIGVLVAEGDPKAVELLKAKRLQEWKDEIRKKEDAEIDEMNVMRHNRGEEAA